MLLFSHQSAQLMEDFLQLARNNTDKDLETCGVLGASLVRAFPFLICCLVVVNLFTSSSSMFHCYALTLFTQCFCASAYSRAVSHSLHAYAFGKSDMNFLLYLLLSLHISCTKLFRSIQSPNFTTSMPYPT